MQRTGGSCDRHSARKIMGATAEHEHVHDDDDDDDGDVDERVLLPGRSGNDTHTHTPSTHTILLLNCF